VVPQAPDGHPRAGKATSAEELLPDLFEPLTRGEGIRVGWIGNTGQGKTFAMAWLIEEALAAGLIDVVVIVDDKNGSPPWQGARRIDPAHLRSNPPDEETEGDEVVIYRGVAMDPRSSVDIDEVAKQGWEIALQRDDEGNRARVMIIVDELRRAVSPAGREWRAPAVARTLAEGRAAGISMLWGTQAPQRIPVEAFDQSLLCIFKTGHRGRAYLERGDLISQQVSAVIAGLAPREFIVVDDAGDWDGVVYEIPLRRRRPPPVEEQPEPLLPAV
jgi:hypothetical protein